MRIDRTLRRTRGRNDAKEDRRARCARILARIDKRDEKNAHAEERTRGTTRTSDEREDRYYYARRISTPRIDRTTRRTRGTTSNANERARRCARISTRIDRTTKRTRGTTTRTIRASEINAREVSQRELIGRREEHAEQQANDERASEINAREES